MEQYNEDHEDLIMIQERMQQLKTSNLKNHANREFRVFQPSVSKVSLHLVLFAIITGAVGVVFWLMSDKVWE